MGIDIYIQYLISLRGERVTVKLEVKNELAKYIVDRFGSRLETKKYMMIVLL